MVIDMALLKQNKSGSLNPNTQQDVLAFIWKKSKQIWTCYEQVFINWAWLWLLTCHVLDMQAAGTRPKDLPPKPKRPPKPKPVLEELPEGNEEDEECSDSSSIRQWVGRSGFQSVFPTGVKTDHFWPFSTVALEFTTVVHNIIFNIPENRLEYPKIVYLHPRYLEST